MNPPPNPFLVMSSNKFPCAGLYKKGFSKLKIMSKLFGACTGPVAILVTNTDPSKTNALSVPIFCAKKVLNASGAFGVVERRISTTGVLSVKGKLNPSGRKEI